MDWSSLPAPALVRMFEFVPVNQLCGHQTCCALVCRRWAEAAFAATSGISLSACADLGSLQLWLRKSGSSLKWLEILRATGELLELPCPQLEHLLLQQNCTSSMRLSDSFFAGLATLSALTSFSFVNLGLGSASSAECWTALVALPALQYLAMTDLVSDSYSIVHTLQECLTSLARSRLEVPGLQQLSYLSLKSSTACGFDSSRVPAAFSCLTALKVLRLSYGRCWFRPSVLSGLVNLQRLDLSCNELGEKLSVPAAELLAILPQLQQLTTLNLGNLDLSQQLEDTPQALQKFSALTASSRLRRLYLSGTSIDSSAALWQHVFPCNRQLPHLDRLKLDGQVPSLQIGSLQRLVQCCPALQVLYISGHQDAPDQDGAPPLASLQQLSALTCLCITQLTDRMASETLALLTGLRSLRVYGVGGLTASGLQQLTALRQLTMLRFNLDPDNTGMLELGLKLYDKYLYNKVSGQCIQTLSFDTSTRALGVMNLHAE